MLLTSTRDTILKCHNNPGEDNGLSLSDVPQIVSPQLWTRHSHSQEKPRYEHERWHPPIACFWPVEVWPATPPAKGIVWNKSSSYVGAVSFQIPCSQCIGCRMARSQDWATRITHEASLHDCNSFISLTYSDQNYPESGSISIRDLQLFCKRVRKSGRRFRFFACGEYGEENWRAHYHIIMFGQDFSEDRVLHRRTGSGHLTYRSATLERLWPYGFSEIGTVTPASAAYVARYVIKKVNGRLAEDHYRRVHPITGEIVALRPEFICMSNKPGIGFGWFQRYQTDAFPSDFLIIDGRKTPVPGYYKRKLNEHQQMLITALRKRKARLRADNNTPERLRVREELQHIRAKRLKRESE